MTDFIDPEEWKGDEIPSSSETYEEVLARHKREVRDMEGKCRAMVKKAPKPEKAIIEARTVQMRFDLKAQHSLELERFEDVGKTQQKSPAESSLILINMFKMMNKVGKLHQKYSKWLPRRRKPSVIEFRVA